MVDVSPEAFLRRTMSKFSAYINDAIQELHHVRWPTRQQAIRLSIIVIGFVAVSTAVFGLVDYGLAQVIKFLLSLT
tara:strand:- start:290 stop:517 length:228 start_codon:yes stop_codon:yes gene_type:complete